MRGHDKTRKYFTDNHVEVWIDSLPRARTAIYAIQQYQRFHGGVQTYLGFSNRAKLLFPDYDFGSVDPTTQTLNGMMLNSRRFITDSGILGSLYFSRDTSTCAH